jgi:phosphatidylserine/phosphatidylglycerophosphate/cardiolipin synthase-like enzyme
MKVESYLSYWSGVTSKITAPRWRTKLSSIPNYEIHFGGPDQPLGRLRDLLAEHIEAVPAGGAIDWVTYYFRDRRLAEQLLRAHRRNVNVTVTLEGNPHIPDANNAVVAMLSGEEGLGKGFRVVYLPPRLPMPGRKMGNPNLHEKLYCFSHPKPVAFIGSFNPSGDDPEERPDIIHEIGDHNRAHNVLVGISEPVLVDGLMNHARWMHRARHGVLERFFADGNRALRGTNTEIHFLPRARSHAAASFLGRFGDGARIRVAASHLNGTTSIKTMLRLARRGATLEILAEPTLRRVSLMAEKTLAEAGIAFRRVTHPERLPMHNKFVLVEQNSRRWVVFGSYNWSTLSFWINQEICAISSQPQLFEAFAERWEVLEAQN